MFLADAAQARFLLMEHLRVLINHFPIIGLAMATLALALVCEGASGWIAFAGGQIRHPEFRGESPPSEPTEHHTH